MANKVKEFTFKTIFLICAAMGIAAVILIAIFLFAKGAPSIAEIGFFKFIFGSTWNPTNGEFGILSMIVNTLFVTAFALIFGVGIGLFCAIYISRFCNKKLAKILKFVVNILAGIPSIIFGFFGMQIIAPILGLFSPTGIGFGILASGIILGIMILPTIVSVSLNSINGVNPTYYEGAVSLGATHSQAVFGVVVPAAKNGILTAIILGVGRAVGETMAVVMVCGGVPQFTASLVESIRTLTGNIVLEMGYAEGLHLGALIATGIVLFVFILIIVLSLNCFNSNKPKKKSKKFAFSSKNKEKNLQTKAEVLKGLSLVGAILMMISLCSVVLYILINGLPHLSWQIVFGAYEKGGPITLLPSIVSTLMIVGLALLIAVPISLGSAIFLNEYTKHGNKFVLIIRNGIEILAGIPSIIYGLFGRLFFVYFLGFGISLLSGSLTVAIMIMPTLIRTIEQSLSEVPDSLREASYALGIGKSRTIGKVVLPGAISGIVSAVILSFGRIFSESAALIYTVGTTLRMPSGYTSGGIALAVYVYMLATEGLYPNEAHAAAVVLLIIVLLLNIFSALVEKLLKRGKNEKKSKRANQKKSAV